MAPFQVGFRIGLLLLLIIILAALLVVWGLDYDAFSAFVISRFGNPAQLTKFQNVLLTPARFWQLRWTMLVFSCCGVLGIAYGWYRSAFFLRAWLCLLRHLWWLLISLTHLLKQTSLFERIALMVFFGLLWAMQWYFAFRLPFHVDERFTYLYFVNKGALVSLAYYPGPNNHILFTLLCNGIDLLLDDPFWVMKISALLVGTLVPVVFWVVVRSAFPAITAFLALMLFATSEKVFYYATQGRGYSLQMIFILIALAATLRLCRPAPVQKAWLVWFGLSCILGFYTIPTFLFPFTGLVLYTLANLLFRRHYAQLWRYFLLLAAVATATFILYLPVFLFNGWSAVSGNSWVTSAPSPMFFRELSMNLRNLAGAAWGMDADLAFWLWLTITGYAIFLAFRQKSGMGQGWAGLWLTHLVGLLLLMLVQRILPFARTLTYTTIFIFPLVALALVSLLKKFFPVKWQWRAACIVALLAFGHTFYRFSHYTNPSRFDLYDSFDGVTRFLYQQHADSVFTQSYEYSLCIRFQYETNNQPLHLNTNQPQPGLAYRFVIVHKSHSFPAVLPRKRYKAVYSDPEATVFERVNE